MGRLFGLTVLLVVSVSMSTAEQSGCKYGKRDGFDAGECDPSTGERTMTLVLKKGDPATCRPTKDVRRPCRVKKGSRDGGEADATCRYEWDEDDSEIECDPATSMKTIRMTLVEGDPDQCATTKTSQRKCADEGKGRRKGGKGRKGKGENRKGKGKDKAKKEDDCRYTVDMSSEEEERIVCDPANNTKSITLVLKPGSPDSCAPNKVITRECVPDGCEYQDGEWTECAAGVETAERIDTLVSPADGIMCKPTLTRSRSCRRIAKIEERKMRKQEAKSEKKESKKVKKNKMKTERREGKKQEKMERKQAKKEARKDRKQKNSQRKMDKEQKRNRRNKRHGRCKYDAGQWDECTEGMRLLTRALVRGNPDLCEPEKIKSISCANKKGEERCFFGKWGKYGECNNGVRTKVRPLLNNNLDHCQRKAAKTQPC